MLTLALYITMSIDAATSRPPNVSRPPALATPNSRPSLQEPADSEEAMSAEPSEEMGRSCISQGIQEAIDRAVRHRPSVSRSNLFVQHISHW